VLSELQTISTTIGILAACISVVIGVVNQILTNRRAEKQRKLTLQTQQQALETRQAQLFMQIYNRWNTTEVSKQYGRIRFTYNIHGWEDYLQLTGYTNGKLENVEAFSDFQTLSQFFEGIGVLVQRGLIDVGLVEDLLANRVIWWWELYQPISEGARKVTGDPKLHNHAEYLYHEMKKRQQQAISSS